MKNSRKGTMTETQIKDFYREFIQYALTATKTFGDDDQYSFDVKREYYLYYFPKPSRFRKFIKSKRELRNNATIKRMISMGEIYPTIKLPRSGKMTPMMKAQVRYDLNSLLYSDDPDVVKFAKDLFMYSFYHDGFNYKSASFGTYFDATFWNAFPEVTDFLRNFRDKTDMTAMSARFLQMWLANHAGDDIIMEAKGPVYREDGAIECVKRYCYSGFNDGKPADFIRAPKEQGSKEYRIFQLDTSTDANDHDYDRRLTYVPLPMFDEPDKVYNVNDTAENMEENYWNNRLLLVEERKKELDEKKKAERASKYDQMDEPSSQNDSADEAESPSADEVAEANGNTNLDDAPVLPKSVRSKLDFDVPAVGDDIDNQTLDISIPIDRLSDEERRELDRQANNQKEMETAHLNSLAGNINNTSATDDAIINSAKDILDNSNLC